MKTIKILAQQFILPAFLLAAQLSSAQNIGIGVAAPQQKLEVNGAIKLASNDGVTPAKGTMRWNDSSNDFEGYNGYGWVSLTGSKNGIGDQGTYTYENAGLDPMLSTATYYNFTSFGKKIVKCGSLYLSAAPDYSSTYAEDLHTNANTGTLLRWYRSAETGTFSYYRITSPAPVAQGKFGFDIAADKQRVIVTEPGAAANGNQGQGKAYIYYNSYANPAVITAANGQANEGFGYAAAISGNYAAVSSPLKFLGNVQSGYVYIFKVNAAGTGWTVSQALTGAAGGEMFGAALAMSNEWLAIGLPKADVNAQNDHGKVQMMRLNTTTGNWTTHSIVWPATGTHNGFGAAVSIKSDTMMITENPDIGGVRPRYYMYLFRNNVWEQVKEFIIPGATFLNGMSQADFLGNRVVIGEANAGIGAADRNGKAHVFEWKNNDWYHTNILTTRNTRRSQQFGRGVLIDNEVILCGAPLANGFYDYSGMLFSFDLP